MSGEGSETRLQAIGEARVQIDDLLTGAPEPITGPTTSLSAPLWPRLALAGVAAVVIGAAVAVTGSWLARPVAPRVTRTNIAAIGPAALTINGLDRDLVISPDGSRVVYVGNNGTQLFVRALDALESAAIATGQIREPFVSPDGQWVGFVDGLNTLKKVAISGGPSMQLTILDGAPQGATWLPDDTIVFATNNPSTGLQRVSSNGGTPAVVTRPDHHRDEVDHTWPQVLPGGRVVLFTITARTGGLDNGVVLTELTPTTGRDLMRLTLDGSHRVTPLLRTPFDELRGDISPDGHWLAYESNSNSSGQFEIYVRPFPNTNVDQRQISTSGGTRPVWAHSGKELFFLGADGALMGAPVEATPTTWNSLAPKKLLEPRYYTGGGNPNRSYDVSPDGQRFLMIKALSADPTTAPPNIIVVQHFDEELRRLVPTK